MDSTAWPLLRSKKLSGSSLARIGDITSPFAHVNSSLMSRTESRQHAEDTLLVTVGGQTVPISRDVFTALTDSSVAGTYADSEKALSTGRIALRKLEKLAHKGEIPLPLFFAPYEIVQAQIQRKNERLLRGLTQKGTFHIGGRQEIRLGEIDLLLKDILRKQEQLKKVDKSLELNPIVGRLRGTGRPAEELADELVDLIGFSRQQFRRNNTKEAALEYFIDTLESKQIFVSRSVSQQYMLQRVPKGLSGLTVRDKKIPYIFLPGNGKEEHSEPAGRRIFTLALLTTLVAQKTFAPVTWNHGKLADEEVDSQPGKAYDIAGAFLMPAGELEQFALTQCDEIEAAAGFFRVTPSAVIVRAARSKMLPWPAAKELLDEFRLRSELAGGSKGARTPNGPNSVARYAGYEYVRRMFQARERGQLSDNDFRLFVTLNRLKPDQYSELRQAVT